MADRRRPFALLAEFAEPQPVLDGARRLREAGFRIETYTPFPVEGLGEAIGFRDRRVPIATLIGGAVGAATGFLIQVYANLDYPLDIGGRPLIAVPAFMLISFELMVLFAVFGAIGTMLVANRLPKLHHPLFDSDRFHLASDDRFFLAVLAGKAGLDGARAALEQLDPIAIVDINERDVS